MVNNFHKRLMEKNKYEVHVNNKEGFKVKFEAQDKDTLQMYKELTEKLYDKVEKIKVEIGNEDY